MNKKSNIAILTEGAVLIAMATALSFVKIWQMPLGGSVTLMSMLPICFMSVKHGIKWGVGTAFVYSLLQLFFGITMSGLLGWGLSPVMLSACIFFDYLAPYTLLGFSGVFRHKGEKGVYIGIGMTILMRLWLHFLSGFVIFSNLERWELFGHSITDAPALYSICYNGMYLLPEMILTLVTAVLLLRVPAMKKLILGGREVRKEK